MSKFSKGDKVLVKDSTFYPNEKTRAFIGEAGYIKEDVGSVYAVWNEEKTDWFGFNESDLEPITETPKEITLNGATYALKEEPKPEHEWKFGDIAVHEEYGVGVVVCVDYTSNELLFAHKVDCDWIGTKDLTFLRRVDLSV